MYQSFENVIPTLLILSWLVNSFLIFFFWRARLRPRPADTVDTVDTIEPGQDLSRVSTVWLRISTVTAETFTDSQQFDQ